MIYYKYSDIYQIDTNRLSEWDYRSSAYYFVTICVKNRQKVFGEIVNDKVILNEYGLIAKKNWLAIPEHCNNVSLDECVVMPDHVNGIVKIEQPELGSQNKDIISGQSKFICRDVIYYVSTNKFTNDDTKHVSTDKLTNDGTKSEYYSKLSPKRGPLSTIIRSYKAACTRMINKKSADFFCWQARFYDKIIRNEIMLNKIRNYIINNPRDDLNDNLNPHALI